MPSSSPLTRAWIYRQALRKASRCTCYTYFLKLANKMRGLVSLKIFVALDNFEKLQCNKPGLEGKESYKVGIDPDKFVRFIKEAQVQALGSRRATANIYIYICKGKNLLFTHYHAFQQLQHNSISLFQVKGDSGDTILYKLQAGNASFCFPL